MATKKTSKSSAKQNKQLSWLKKRWIPVSVAVSVAGIGVYMLAFSSASTDPALLASSFSGGSCKTLPVLQQGDSGECVRVVKRALDNRNENLKQMQGIDYEKLGNRERFNAKTKAAVERFQREYSAVGKRLAVTGVVDQATWSLLMNDCLVWSFPHMIGQPIGQKGTITSEVYGPGYACTQKP